MGSRTRAQLAESLAALEVKLSPTEIADLEAAIRPEEVAGTRYDEHQMKVLDSEK
jgi:aryl-alcohol dehydrogenase-like predicted oxidoreductase